MSIDTRALFSTLEEIDEEIEFWRREGRNDVARQIEQTKAEAMRTGEVREATPPLLATYSPTTSRTPLTSCSRSSTVLSPAVRRHLPS